MAQTMDSFGWLSDEEYFADLARRADGCYQNTCIWQRNRVTDSVGFGPEPYMSSDSAASIANLIAEVAEIETSDLALKNVALAKLYHAAASCELRGFTNGMRSGASHEEMQAHVTNAEEMLKRELGVLEEMSGISATILVVRAKALYADLLNVIGYIRGALELLKDALLTCNPAVEAGSKEALLLQSDVLMLHALVVGLDITADANYYELAAEGYAYFDDDQDSLFREAVAYAGAAHHYVVWGDTDKARQASDRAVLCAIRLSGFDAGDFSRSEQDFDLFMQIEDAIRQMDYDSAFACRICLIYAYISRVTLMLYEGDERAGDYHFMMAIGFANELSVLELMAVEMQDCLIALSQAGSMDAAAFAYELALRCPRKMGCLAKSAEGHRREGATRQMLESLAAQLQAD